MDLILEHLLLLKQLMDESSRPAMLNGSILQHLCRGGQSESRERGLVEFRYRVEVNDDTGFRASSERVAQYLGDFGVIEGDGNTLVSVDE
jgi:hypothetical protein